MRISSVVLLTVVVCVATYGGYAKANVVAAEVPLNYVYFGDISKSHANEVNNVIAFFTKPALAAAKSLAAVVLNPEVFTFFQMLNG